MGPATLNIRCLNWQNCWIFSDSPHNLIAVIKMGSNWKLLSKVVFCSVDSQNGETGYVIIPMSQAWHLLPRRPVLDRGGVRWCSTAVMHTRKEPWHQFHTCGNQTLGRAVMMAALSWKKREGALRKVGWRRRECCGCGLTQPVTLQCGPRWQVHVP